MNILTLLTSGSILAKQFGFINTEKLAKLAKSKFSEDVYVTVKFSGKKLEKNILKVKKTEDWKEYFTKISSENKLIRMEITDAVNPKYTLIYENFPKKKTLVLTKLSDYKSIEEMYRNIATGNNVQNLAEEVIEATKFSNTKLYTIYNSLYKLINISSLVIFGLVFMSIFVEESWAKLWVNSLLRGVLIYAGISLCTQIIGFWLRKYPNLVWINQPELLKKIISSNKNDTWQIVDKFGDKKEEDQDTQKYLISSKLVNSRYKYVTIFTPVVMLACLILYYIIFLP